MFHYVILEPVADRVLFCFVFCNWGHLTEVSTGSAFEAMSIPFAFQTQAGSRARISHVRNLTKLIMSILSRNFPSGISYRSTIELIDPQ